jgi:hypothetical protein
MSPQKSKLSSWASGEESDSQPQAKAPSKRLEQWVGGETAAANKPKASLIRRLKAWAGGEQAGGEEAGAEMPQAAPSKPAAAPKPAAAAPAKPAFTRPTSTPAKPNAEPAALDSENASALAGQLAGLQGDLALTEQNNQIQQARRELEAAAAMLQACRSRGYIFQKELENTSAALEKQAAELRARLDEQVRALKTEAGAMETLLSKGAAAAKGALVILENKVRAAVGTLQGDCQTFTQRVGQLSQAVKKIAWALNQLEQASFSLTASEALVDATQAVWKNSSNTGEVKGVLYLTDLRLILERKDEQATKKILFVTTATEKRQNLEWEAPVQLLEKALSSQQGLLGLREQLLITFASGGPYPQVTLWLDGTDETTVSSSDWAAVIGRVKSGVVAQDRTIPLDPTADQTAKLPTKCPSCGAVFTQTVLRGQTEIDCQYCGLKVRL